MSATTVLGPGEALLEQVIRRAARTVPFYRERYRSEAVDINTALFPRDLPLLPIVSPEELTAASEDFRAADIVPYRISSSSGTSRRPKTLYRTSRDTDTGAEVLGRLLAMAGVGAGDILLIGQPFDLAHIGYLTLEACRRAGVLALPVGIGFPDSRLVQLLEIHSPNAIFTAPSRMASLTRLFRSDPQRQVPPLTKILLAGEPITDIQQDEITSFWDVEPHNLYGSEETDGLGGSCRSRAGLHFMDDLFVMELVEPGTSRIAAGDTGELVITSLYAEGTPLIRYRLGDLVKRVAERCQCGAPFPLIEVLGRPDDVFVLYDGVKLRSYQLRCAIEQVLDGTPRFQAICREPRPGSTCVELIIDHPPVAAETAEQLHEAVWASSLDLIAAAEMGCIEFTVTFGTPVVTARGKSPTFLDLRQGQQQVQAGE